jgi:hypothetical protein
MNWEEEIKKESNELKIVNSVIMYFNNTRPDDLIDMLFGRDIHGGYYSQWVGYYRGGFQVFWSRLDDGNRQKFIDAALKRGV